MKRISLLVFFVFALFSSVFSQSLVRVYTTDVQILSHLDVASVRPGAYADVVLWEKDKEYLLSTGVDYKLLIDDLPGYYASRLDPTLSMGGYHTYSEAVAWLDSIYNEHPDIVLPPESIGYSCEGRAVYMIKISDNPTVDEDEPELLYDAMHHAREPGSMEILLYFISYLLDNYGISDDATYLVNNRELFFIPIVNPDGYVYNELTNPGGGGMWRKNRRNNGDGTFGVDLNRNYSYMWGYDDEGSSPNPADETYRGLGPFSEPETQAMRDFYAEHNILLNLSYHTYSAMYLSPWGYTADTCADHSKFMEMMQLFSKENHYVYGPGATAIYLTNGDANDWAYGDTITKPRVLSVTPEAGSGEDGFWPPTERIIPINQDNLPANIRLAYMAVSYVHYGDIVIFDSLGNENGFFDPGETLSVSCRVRNCGLGTSREVIGRIVSASPHIEVIRDSVLWSPVGSFESSEYESFLVYLSNDAERGAVARIILSCTEGIGYVEQETVSFIIGTPETLFAESFDGSGDDFFVVSGSEWQRGVPVADVGSHSSPNVWATVLSGDYHDRQTAVLSSPVVHLDSTAKYLSFWHWYDFEYDGVCYDGGNVKIVVDGGTPVLLSPLTGYTGIFYEHSSMAGDSCFSGVSNGWKNVMFDISAYCGEDVRFLFSFCSDNYVHHLGWYIDDFAVIGYTAASVEAEERIALSSSLGLSVSPNPFNSRLMINILGNSDGEHTVTIKNILGETVVVERLPAGVKSFSYEPRAGGSGVYFVTLTDGECSVTKKVVYLK
ncbi:T9SS type A sorting domain-containing protein [bacterium]|nr:T9SS type A sorting domain-containing protein [bacterium]